MRLHRQSIHQLHHNSQYHLGLSQLYHPPYLIYQMQRTNHNQHCIVYKQR
uniref:Uncharacterized protein n=1 Tax=uncultured marine virus TaxID=186617 RepID=A0A0F7L391_9VIRU|nr:hypothetical protein [uncultured marine virus]